MAVTLAHHVAFGIENVGCGCCLICRGRVWRRGDATAGCVLVRCGIVGAVDGKRALP
jgi:hypothetical protein